MTQLTFARQFPEGTAERVIASVLLVIGSARLPLRARPPLLTLERQRRSVAGAASGHPLGSATEVRVALSVDGIVVVQRWL